MSSQPDIHRRTLLKAAGASLAFGAAGIVQIASAAGQRQGRTMTEKLDAETLSALQASMDNHVRDGYIAGAVWAIERGSETHIGTAGSFQTNGGKPMARDTIFRVASITKPVTAVAAMKLVESGVIGLDDPVDRFLPELANRRVLRNVEGSLDDTVAAERPVTLRDLLTMRFGLGAIMVFPERYPIQAAMREAGIAPGFALPKLTSDAYMERLGTLPLAYQPGARFLYNNGLDVAGILVERATGKRLGEIMREWIFGPLGMRDTGFFVPPEKLERLPSQYGPDFAAGDGTIREYGPADGIDFAAPPPMDSGAGGLVSTIDDYLAFYRMMLNGGEYDGTRILNAQTVAQMASNQLSPEQMSTSDATPFTANGGAGWGLGMSVAVKKTKPWLTPGRFGWDGGYGTSAHADPENNLIGLLFSQRLMDSPEPPKTYVDFWTQAYKTIV